jgi:FkbM family methyltransferase
MVTALSLIAYFFLAHLLARRGFKTGLHYWRVFLPASFPLFLPLVAIWVFWRNKRKGIYYERLRKFYSKIRFILNRELEVLKAFFPSNRRHPFPKTYPYSALEYIPIPENVSEVFIDIGLSYSAPNSCLWLIHRPESFVLALEASPTACRRLAQNGMSVIQRGYRVTLPNARCSVFNVAVGSNNQVLLNEMAGDIGTSSTLTPTSNFLSDTKYRKSRVVSVNGVTLDKIIASIPKSRFPLISGIKIDAQGSDLSIIKSGSEELKSRVVYLSCEINTFNQYHEAPTSIEIKKYLESIGFTLVRKGSLVNNQLEDATFLNTKFCDHVDTTWWTVL